MVYKFFKTTKAKTEIFPVFSLLDFDALESGAKSGNLGVVLHGFFSYGISDQLIRRVL